MATPSEPAGQVLLWQVRNRRDAIRSALLDWWPTAARPFPWRRPGRSAYEVLVAELLLKRTTSAAAARVYEDFLSRFPTIEALAGASLGELESALSTVGLQRQRAKAAKELASNVVGRWHGEIPGDMEQLLTIPHVGPYAAAAVRSFALGRPSAIVDSNAHRVISRLFRHFLPNAPSFKVVQRVASELLPADRHREFNLGLLDLEALLCAPQSPRCTECPLARSCDFGQSNS